MATTPPPSDPSSREASPAHEAAPAPKAAPTHEAAPAHPITAAIPVGGDESHLSAPGFRMFDRGAHVTHWRPASSVHPVLYSSSLARIGEGQAWRGGIPICAPWFASGPDGARTPSHGPARTAQWVREAERASGTQHAVELDLDATGAPALLVLDYATQRTERSLEVVLTITNAGRDTALVEAALHTYLAVSDVTTIEVRGLEGVSFAERDTGATSLTAPLTFGGPIDRVYSGSPRVDLVDDAWGRTLHIERFGAAQTVVWNPGPDHAPADVGAGEWRSFLCVEAAILGDGAVSLAPDQSHRLTSAITLETH